MKKNISINICGTIYSIDEDAYQLLEHYLDSMKRYFSQEGEEEISDDIEHRVAELLWEQKHNGKDAVSIEMVKEIIEKIGNPADIANETKTHEENEEFFPKSKKSVGLYSLHRRFCGDNLGVLLANSPRKKNKTT